jgi:hypothetical protein
MYVKRLPVSSVQVALLHWILESLCATGPWTAISTCCNLCYAHTWLYAEILHIHKVQSRTCVLNVYCLVKSTFCPLIPPPHPLLLASANRNIIIGPADGKLAFSKSVGKWYFESVHFVACNVITPAAVLFLTVYNTWWHYNSFIWCFKVKWALRQHWAFGANIMYCTRVNIECMIVQPMYVWPWTLHTTYRVSDLTS